MLVALLFFLVAFLQPVLADSSLGPAMQKMCGTLSSITSCKSALNIPTAKLRYASQKWLKYNGCKTRYRFPFGGWTCVPGTDAVWIEVPVGIDIGSRRVSVCDLMKQTFGSDALLQMSSKSGAICKCLPEILSVLDKDGMRELLGSGSLSKGSGQLMQKFGEFSQCATDAGFSVYNDRKGLMEGSGALVPSSNTLIFRAAEINLSRYVSFAAAITPCFFGGCQTETIRGWFESYVSDSEKAMKAQILEVLRPWFAAFTTVENNFARIEKSTADIGGRINGLQADAVRILDDFCPDIGNCTSNTVKAFKAEVTKTLDFAKQIAEAQAVVADVVTDVKQVVTIVEQTIAAFEALDMDLDDIVLAVVNGKFRSFEELAGALKAAQRLPSIINDVQKSLPKMNSIFNEIKDKGPAFVDSLQGILTDNWLRDFEGDAALAEKMKAGIYELQGKMAELVPQATDLWNGISVLADAVGDVATGEIGAVNIRVASYRRWTRGNFVLPCLTTGTWTFEIAGFKASAGYPKFYRCSQNYNVPFPNHHIPFIKLEMPENSPLLKYKRKPTGSTTSITWNGVRPTGAAPMTAALPQSTPVAAQSIAPAPPASDPAAVPSPALDPAPSPVEPSVPVASPPAETPVAAPDAGQPPAAVVPSDPAAAAITSAPAVRRGLRIWRMDTLAKRQAVNDVNPDGEPQEAPPAVNDEIPPDVTETGTFALPTDVFSDAGAASAAAANAPPATAVFASTTMGGVATTVQVDTQVTGQPIATEVMPEAAGTAAAPQATEFAPYGNPSAAPADATVLSDVSMSTVAVDMSAPTASADPGGSRAGGDKKEGGARAQALAGWVGALGVLGGSVLVLAL